MNRGTRVRQSRAMDIPTDPRITDLFGVELPVIQAPMAGANGPEMVIAVSEAGGLGSLPGALYTPQQLADALETVRAGTQRPINLNFFAYAAAPEDATKQAAWRERLLPYYVEAAIAPDPNAATNRRASFDEDYCAIVESFRPEGRQLPFRIAGRIARRACQARRREIDRIRDDGRRSSVARSARRRRGDRDGARKPAAIVAIS